MIQKSWQMREQKLSRLRQVGKVNHHRTTQKLLIILQLAES